MKMIGKVNRMKWRGQLSSFKVGQRFYFAVRDGEIVIHPKPVRVVDGKLPSRRVRHTVRSHAAWAPR